MRKSDQKDRIHVESIHKESASGQFKILLRNEDTLKAIDNYHLMMRE